jgi:hypothetical protein
MNLMLNGSPIYFGGVNAYFLPDPTTSIYSIEDAFAAMQEMGVTIFRCMNLAVYIGTATSYEPSLHVFNPNAFTNADYIIKRCGDLGIKVFAPLMFPGNYRGGLPNFCTWLGVSTSNVWTDPNVAAAVDEYQAYVLNHVNQFTGVAWKNDPTIAWWEVGSELNDNLGYPPFNWVDTRAANIKAIDSNHLLMDTTNLTSGGHDNMASQYLDICCDHAYPPTPTQLATSAAQAQAYNKPYVLGEAGWNDGSPSDLQAWLTYIEGDPRIAGSAVWNLSPHNLPNSFMLISDGPGRDLWYPGMNADQQLRIQLLRNHSYKMAGLSLPSHAIPSAPAITAVTSTGQNNVVKWRGSASACRYELDALSASGTRWSTVTSNVTDFQTPYTDMSAPASSSTRYRIRGFNLDGTAGPYSPIFTGSSFGVHLGTDDFINRAMPMGAPTWDIASDGQTWSTLAGTPVLTITGSTGDIATITGSQSVIMKLGSHTGTTMAM